MVKLNGSKVTKKNILCKFFFKRNSMNRFWIQLI